MGSINWNKNGERWTNGKLKIQKGTRAYTEEVVNGRTYRPYNPDLCEVYHCYDDGKYLGQSDTLTKSKNGMQKHKDKKDKE